jgi:hypothetical protein
VHRTGPHTQPKPPNGIRVVVEADDRCEAPAAAEYPLLDLAVPILNAGADGADEAGRETTSRSAASRR